MLFGIVYIAHFFFSSSVLLPSATPFVPLVCGFIRRDNAPINVKPVLGGGGVGRATHENLTEACISVGILIILIFQLQRAEGK